MGGGVELLCLYGSVTGKAESIATQVAKGFFSVHAMEAWNMGLTFEGWRPVMIRGLICMWCRLLKRLASLDGRLLCAAWERC